MAASLVTRHADIAIEFPQTDAILRHGLTRPRAILPTYPKTDNERGWNEPMQAFLDQASDEEKADLTKLLAQPVCTNYPIK